MYILLRNLFGAIYMFAGLQAFLAVLIVQKITPLPHAPSQTQTKDTATSESKAVNLANIETYYESKF